MTDIFESPTTPETTPAPPAVALPDEARELIGEGKKYGSVEAALKALPHAQSHISTLERELKELRETLAKERALSESMTVINGQAPVKPATSVFDESVISSVIDRKLQETAEKRLSDANVAEFKAAMSAKFGDKASEVWRAKATEIGVSTDFLTQLISKSATAGKELFGLKNDTKPIPPTSGAKVNTTVLNNSQPTQPVKPVMGGVKTADLVNAWRAAQAQVMDKYK
jgi:hypothetical protein